MPQPAAIQPIGVEKLYCRTCTEMYYLMNGREMCCATTTTVKPTGCPTAERAREAYDQSLQARRIALGKSPYSIVARHREPEEAANYENDHQTICYDCEATHQLSCLCFGQKGVPDDCKTYNARRIVIEGTPTSRYDIHESGLSMGEELKVELPMIEEEE